MGRIKITMQGGIQYKQTNTKDTIQKYRIQYTGIQYRDTIRIGYNITNTLKGYGIRDTRYRIQNTEYRIQ